MEVSEESVRALRAKLEAAENELAKQKKKEKQAHPLLVVANEIFGFSEQWHRYSGEASAEQIIKLLEVIPKEQFRLDGDQNMFEDEECFEDGFLTFMKKYQQRSRAEISYHLRTKDTWVKKDTLMLAIHSVGLSLKDLDQVPTSWLGDVSKFCGRYDMMRFNSDHVSVIDHGAYGESL